MRGKVSKRNFSFAFAGIAMIALLPIAGCKDVQRIISNPKGPSKVISLGFVRPVSCTYQGDFLGGAGYECIMKNYSDGPRKSDIECNSFDEQGRIMGRAKNGKGLTRIVFSAGEERVGTLYFDPKASLAACADVENSIPPYADVLTLVSAPEARDIVSELML